MAQMIDLREARYIHAQLGPQSPRDIGPQDCSRALPRPASNRTETRTLIARFVLDVGARQARLLVNKINNPSRGQNFETQIATIEQLLQLARDIPVNVS